VLRSDLHPGDILLLLDTPDNSTFKHKLISTGQKLTSVKFWRKNKGAAKFVHALLWVGNGSLSMPDVAEASGSGRVRTERLGYGTYVIYRSTNSDLSDCAADAALNWAKGGIVVMENGHYKHKPIPYAKGKAVFSVVHSDSFGEQGQNRAQEYGNQITTSTPAWGEGGAFCSEFVVACYQAAAQHLNLQLQGDVLECDAKHCSVRALHDRLFRDANFKRAGELDYDLDAIARHTH
jgi:hypothetical protein